MKRIFLSLILTLILSLSGITKGQDSTWTPPNPVPKQDNWTWTTTDGKTYSKVKIVKVEPDSVTILNSDGGARVPISTLPVDIQKQLNYNPELAKQVSVQRDTNQQNELNNQAIRRQQKNNQLAKSEQYEKMFKLPEKGHSGQMGEVIRVEAKFYFMLSPSVTAVEITSTVVEPYTDERGILHDGGTKYREPIAVYGLPDNFAENSPRWKGILYPAGTAISGSTKYFVYATTKEKAIEVMESRKN